MRRAWTYASLPSKQMVPQSLFPNPGRIPASSSARNCAHANSSESSETTRHRDRAKSRSTKIGIGDHQFTVLDLRHTWASWHVQNGTPLQELMELGSWASFEMVLRYAHLAADHLRGAACRIDGTLAPQTKNLPQGRASLTS